MHKFSKYKNSILIAFFFLFLVTIYCVLFFGHFNVPEYNTLEPITPARPTTTPIKQQQTQEIIPGNDRIVEYMLTMQVTQNFSLLYLDSQHSYLYMAEDADTFVLQIDDNVTYYATPSDIIVYKDGQKSSLEYDDETLTDSINAITDAVKLTGNYYAQTGGNGQRTYVGHENTQGSFDIINDMLRANIQSDYRKFTIYFFNIEKTHIRTDK